MSVFFTSCAKEFRNPYDPATPPDIWMPKAFKLDTLGTNALRLKWNQDEQHIDGFAIQKTTNGQIKEILLPLDSLRYTDIQAVDTSSDEVCPELSYKVMARAGNNRSLDIGTTSVIRMPLSTPASAGTDVIVTDTSTTTQLNAQAPNAGERGQWTLVSGIGGAFSNLNAHNSNFTGLPCTEYVLRWTKTGCTETFDEVNVKFQKAITIANAGASQNIATNATQATLAANAPASGEAGAWTIVTGVGGSFSNTNSATSTFTGNACTNYILRWTISGLCSSSIDELSVNFQKATTTANAGVNQTITSTETQATLAANGPEVGETGTWSILSGVGGSFSNINSPTSTFLGNPCTNYSLRWAIQGLCSSNDDDVFISFSQSNTIANAGADQTPTTLTTTLAANAVVSGQIGLWSIVSGTGGSFSNVNSPTSIFTGSLGQSYSLKWSISTCNNTSNDIVNIIFPLSAAGSGVSDIDGNFYPTTIIGTQEWMGKNLRTTKYANGNTITYFTTWPSLTSSAPGYGYYNNSSSNNSVYGKLYNWYAATDPRNVCPTGWHVPSKIEWDVLFSYIGSVGPLKETGSSHWLTPNTGATNTVNFTALPGGFILSGSQGIGQQGWHLSTTTDVNNSGYAELERMYYNNSSRQNTQYYKSGGYSIRCLRD